MGASMEIVRELPEPGAATPASVAIGNFDGVHRGHRFVIDAARGAAQAQGLSLGVVTFEPHPRDVFQPDSPPFRLTLEPLKARRMAALGVDRLFVLPFGPALISLTAEQFAADILSQRIGARHVAVGEDFRFGAKRAGDVAALRRFGRAHDFGVSAVTLQGDGEAFSSTAARQALVAGRPQEAARILGDWHRLEGVVEKGDQRGRELGFPTANMALGRMLRPAFGIYAVRAEVLDGPHKGVFDGVASLGVRPTFAADEANFETYLFDFDGDLYGATLSVSLCAYLRSEAKFDSIDALVAQMNADSAEARRVLADLPEQWK